MHEKRIKSILQPLLQGTSLKKRSEVLDFVVSQLQKELAPTTIILNDEETAYIIQNYRGKTAGLEKNIKSMTEQRDALQKFKDFVHQRLDKMGIPTHPDGEHSKAGCRIGDRLDIVSDYIWKYKDLEK